MLSAKQLCLIELQNRLQKGTLPRATHQNAQPRGTSALQRCPCMHTIHYCTLFKRAALLE